MDKQQLAAAAAVMIAASNGAEIQFRSKSVGAWTTQQALSWDWYNFEYRVKPKTIKARMYLDKSDGYTAIYLFRGDAGAGDMEKSQSFVRWLTDWIEVEV